MYKKYLQHLSIILIFVTKVSGSEEWHIGTTEGTELNQHIMSDVFYSRAVATKTFEIPVEYPPLLLQLKNNILALDVNKTVETIKAMDPTMKELVLHVFDKTMHKIHKRTEKDIKSRGVSGWLQAVHILASDDSPYGKLYLPTPKE